MLIKFLEHGTGSAHDAVKYLLGSHDHQGIERPEIRVLRGDPGAVADVADSLEFRHRYTSGVIAFAPVDAPTDAQISALLDDFERVAYAGLEPDRVSFTAILHREQGGGCHIHVLAARVDLETGKSLNIAPPGWEKSFDPLRDMHNMRNGWARPDDPGRARTFQPGHHALIQASALRAGIEVEPDPKALITRFLEQRIETGLISDRVGIIESLREAGLEINRQGTDYISVKDAQTGQKIRLRGGIYEQSFKPGGADAIADSARPGADRATDERGAAAAQRAYEKAVQRRYSYNQERYQKRGGATARDDLQYQDANGTASIEATQADLVSNAGAPSGHSVTVRADRGRDMALPTESANDSPDRADQTPGRENGNDHHQPGLDDVQERQRAAAVLDQITSGENHDGTRNDIDAIAQEVDARIRAARAATAEAIERARNASASLEQTGRRLAAGATAVRSQADAELEAIKREVNLVEYAENAGYQVLPRESSKNSVAMKRGDEKIIIATAADGHGIYFNVRDPNDSGSVIDFAQKRHSLNLGQARRELRPWAGLATKGPLTHRQRMRRPPAMRPARPTPITRDQAAVLAAFHQLRPYGGTYLQQRGLDDETITAFGDVLRSDGRSNTCMIHKDGSGNVTGWELKNQSFAGFSAGGAKSLFIHDPDPADDRKPRRLCIFESAIDAMSYHQRHGRKGDRYASTGGGMSQEQIRLAAELAKQCIEVLFGFDGDAAGDGYAAQLQKAIPHGERIRPAMGKDWNDELRAAAATSPRRLAPRRP